MSVQILQNLSESIKYFLETRKYRNIHFTDNKMIKNHFIFDLRQKREWQTEILEAVRCLIFIYDCINIIL